MPRKSKKSDGVHQTVHIHVHTEKKKKPRKKRSARKKKVGFSTGAIAPYGGPSTIYGEPLPLPRQTIEVNVPYLLQSGQRLATGEIGVPLLQNAPMRDMIMNAPQPQRAPSIIDDTASQRSYMKPNYQEELNTIEASSRQENQSIADMEEPHEPDAFDLEQLETGLAEGRKSKSLFQSVKEGAKEYAIPAVSEIGANALIGGLATAGQGVGIPYGGTFAVLSAGKEFIKAKRTKAKTVKIAEESAKNAVREYALQAKPHKFKVDSNTMTLFEKYFKDDKSARNTLNQIKKLYPYATNEEVDNFLSNGVPLSRKI